MAKHRVEKAYLTLLTPLKKMFPVHLKKKKTAGVGGPGVKQLLTEHDTLA